MGGNIVKASVGNEIADIGREPMSFGQEETLAHLLFCSVAERAVELAQRPLLVVKLLSVSD